MVYLCCGICLFLWLIGYSSCQQFQINNLGDGYDWNQAMEVCGNNGGSIPQVQTIITGNQTTSLTLVNKELLNENHCFWIKAKYERVDSLTDYSYPASCCETLFKDREWNAINRCAPCNLSSLYRCENESNNAGLVTFDHATWPTAAEVCRTRAHSLLSETNQGLLNLLPLLQSMWINSVRRLNINPVQGDAKFALCVCNGFPVLSCQIKPRTYCVYLTTTGIPIKVTESMNVAPNSSFSSVDHAETTVIHKSETSLSTPMKKDKVALIASLTAAGVVLIIVVIIIVQFLYRRSKKTENKNSNSKSPENADNSLNGSIYMNIVHEDCDGKFPHANTKGTTDTQESGTYAFQTKVGRSSDIKQNNYSDIKIHEEESNMAMYNVVNKGRITGQRLNSPNHKTAGMKSYDKVTCGKSNDVEHSHDIYDKTSFHHEFNRRSFKTERLDMYAGNDYDKACFHSETEYKSSGDLYDRANFHGETHNETSGNVYDKVSIRLETQHHHSGNVYAKSDIKSISPDDHSENEYDN